MACIGKAVALHSNVLAAKPCLEQTCSRPRLSAAGVGMRVATDPAEVVVAVALEFCCCCTSLCLPRQGQGENGCY